MTRFPAFGAGADGGDVQTQAPLVTSSSDFLPTNTLSGLPASFSGSPYSTNSPQYRGGASYFSHPPVEQPRDRHHSLSSSSGGGDSQWGSTSYEEPRSRSASLYSLSNHFVGMGVQLEGSISAPPLQAVPADLQLHSPSSQAKLIGSDFADELPSRSQYPQDSRRLSADPRPHPGKIVTTNLQPASSNQNQQAHARAMTSSLSTSGISHGDANSRMWPWDPSMQSHQGARHGSLSAFPYSPPASLNHAGPSSFPDAPYLLWPSTHVDHTQHSPISPYLSPPAWGGRHRSMSSSAIPGRPYSDGSPGYFTEHLTSPLAGAPGSIGLTTMHIPQQDQEESNPGGPNRRRIKFRRSRTGCLMCRQRKVKCAQDGTPCKQCRVGKRDCQYQENVPQRRRNSKPKKSGAASTDADDDNNDTREDHKSISTASGTSGEPHQSSDSGVVFSMPFQLQHLSPASQALSVNATDAQSESWMHSPYDAFSASTPSSSNGSGAAPSVGAGVSPLGLGMHVPLQPLTSTAAAAASSSDPSQASPQTIATPLTEWNHVGLFYQPTSLQNQSEGL